VVLLVVAVVVGPIALFFCIIALCLVMRYKDKKRV